MSTQWDAIIIGGGAAGLFCAGVAGQRNQKRSQKDHEQGCQQFHGVIPPVSAKTYFSISELR